MGKFDGVLIATDFDDTYCSSGSFVHPDNYRMLDYFESQGGSFTVATGRAIRTFAPLLDLCPVNAPVVAANGAQLYDFSARRMLVEEPLPDTIVADLQALVLDHPALSVEVYHGDQVYAWNPNDWSRFHFERARVSPEILPLEQIPLPWDKAILQNDYEILLPAQKDILARWGDRYEAIFSCFHMLELNSKGCTKGSRVLDLAQRLGIARENIYCAGDNQNDLPMLAVSAIPFAPANCSQEVKDFGAYLLPACQDGAIAELIRVLDKKY